MVTVQWLWQKRARYVLIELSFVFLLVRCFGAKNFPFCRLITKRNKKGPLLNRLLYQIHTLKEWTNYTLARIVLKLRPFKFLLAFWHTIVCCCDEIYNPLHFSKPMQSDYSISISHNTTARILNFEVLLSMGEAVMRQRRVLVFNHCTVYICEQLGAQFDGQNFVIL